MIIDVDSHLRESYVQDQVYVPSSILRGGPTIGVLYQLRFLAGLIKSGHV